MKQQKTNQSRKSTSNQYRMNSKRNLSRVSKKGIVVYGKATELTKGKGGRHSEQGYSRP